MMPLEMTQLHFETWELNHLFPDQFYRHAVPSKWLGECRVRYKTHVG